MSDLDYLSTDTVYLVYRDCPYGVRVFSGAYYNPVVAWAKSKAESYDIPMIIEEYEIVDGSFQLSLNRAWECRDGDLEQTHKWGERVNQ